MQKVLAKAEDMNMLGDEENTYIMYMKLFALIQIIQNSKHFKDPNVKQSKESIKIKQSVRDILGSNEEIRKRMDLLEKLKVKLTER